MTHYPQALEDGLAITTQEAWTERGLKVCLPDFMKEIIEEIAFAARKSEYVDQTSGVSARLPISAIENLVSNVEKRALLTGDKVLYPRICDLIAVVPSVTGKVELVYEGEQEGPGIVAFNLIGRAVKEVFGRYFPEVPKSGAPSGNSQYAEVLRYFSSGHNIELSDEATFEQYLAALNRIPGLRKIVEEHLPPGAKEEIPLRMELILEGLHQHNLIGKETFENAFRYTDMLSTMLRGMED